MTRLVVMIKGLRGFRLMVEGPHRTGDPPDNLPKGLLNAILARFLAGFMTAQKIPAPLLQAASHA
jgi:hypothetical protein